MTRIIGFSLLFVGAMIPAIQAQVEHVSWSSIRARVVLDEKTRMDVRPIFRFNEDLSNYQNMSIDYVFNRKLGKGWSGQLLARHWFIPNEDNRLFLWFDVGHSLAIKKLSLLMYNRVRIHWAVDIHGQVLRDFIRIQNRIAPDLKSKVVPFFSIEPWLQLNGIGKFRRIRIEPGLIWKISTELSFELMIRRQRNLGLPTSAKQNHYVTTLTYNL